ncbi:hypothetical protein Ddye_014610 [Dipteronia dyeriana]|uniref:Disease resistance R13L4/SHOC-2-like LRR domain-containing protein n=1 Tax=Dipteronia dyeriana TaxID=168575 RepID=A0AAD9X8D2_9ROSI|nr:hypothetical protein Ddye_014610 [Dipteronia dyeriana]
MPCHLEWLELRDTAIEELPSSIKYLRRLVKLDLCDCKRLKSLPTSFCEWKSLQILKLSSCSMLEELPSDIETLESLKELEVLYSAMEELPSSLIYLKNIKKLTFDRLGAKKNTAVCWFLPPTVGWQYLTYLDLSYNGFTYLPDDLDCISSLRILYLDGNSFESIPTSIINLSNLKGLSIQYCKKLQYLPALQLVWISAFGCTSLEVLPCFSIFRNIIDGSDVIFADFGNCFKSDPNIMEDIVKDALWKVQNREDYIYDEDYDLEEYAFIRYVGSEIPKCVVATATALCIDDQGGLKEDWCIQWTCNLKSKDGNSCFKTGEFDCGRLGNWAMETNHVFVDSCAHISCSELLRYNNITFQFYISHNMKQHKVEKCGVHLKFDQYHGEDDGSSRIREDEDVLSLANAHDYCECEEEDEGEIPRMSENFEGIVRRRRRDEEHESRSGSDCTDGGSGDDQDAADNPPRKKRNHQHTPHRWRSTIIVLFCFFPFCLLFLLNY